MRVGVPTETLAGERRVALVPEAARGLVKGGLEVVVESGAGASAFFSDAIYMDAGAKVTDAATALGSDAVLKVQPPTPDEVGRLRAGAVLISFLQPATNAEVVAALAKQKVSAFLTSCPASAGRRAWTRCPRRPALPATSPCCSRPITSRSSFPC